MSLLSSSLLQRVGEQLIFGDLQQNEGVLDGGHEVDLVQRRVGVEDVQRLDEYHLGWVAGKPGDALWAGGRGLRRQHHARRQSLRRRLHGWAGSPGGKGEERGGWGRFLCSGPLHIHWLPAGDAQAHAEIAIGAVGVLGRGD